MDKQAYPILEYDGCRTAKLNPEELPERKLETDRLVVTFFPEVVRKLLDTGAIVPARTIEGENPILLYRFRDADTLLTLGAIGCPACAGNLDLLHAMGIEKVMFCGGGGVLDSGIGVGQLLVVDGAIRDEGFSYHYLPPSRCVMADPAVTAVITDHLTRRGIPFLRGLTWTTDAMFRETEERILRRRAEGARIVEMEQAGCLAVARFRGFAYGALIYGGDDVSGGEWAPRSWRSRESIRFDLVQLCRELAELL